MLPHAPCQREMQGNPGAMNLPVGQAADRAASERDHILPPERVGGSMIEKIRPAQGGVRWRCLC
jgi:hypothetical protein